MLRCFVLCIAGAVVVAIRMRFKVNTILHNYMLLIFSLRLTPIGSAVGTLGYIKADGSGESMGNVGG